MNALQHINSHGPQVSHQTLRRRKRRKRGRLLNQRLRRSRMRRARRRKFQTRCTVVRVSTIVRTEPILSGTRQTDRILHEHGELLRAEHLRCARCECWTFLVIIMRYLYMWTGTGSYGAVKLAKHKQTDHMVAIKVQRHLPSLSCSKWGACRRGTRMRHSCEGNDTLHCSCALQLLWCACVPDDSQPPNSTLYPVPPVVLSPVHSYLPVHLTYPIPFR